ncbi:MAG: cobalt-precorrin-7 (C(5))-methyltransferase, partial [Hyphomicrobiales bacterium]
MTEWLHIIGFGEGELPTLPHADAVIGPQRIIDRLQAASATHARLIPWRSLKLDDMIAHITALRGTRTIMLASGDPLWFGMGATLTRHLASDEFRVTPHASSFQYAAARLRWPLQHVATLSAHAR